MPVSRDTMIGAGVAVVLAVAAANRGRRGGSIVVGLEGIIPQATDSVSLEHAGLLHAGSEAAFDQGS